MDMQLLSATIAISKSIPGTAAERAETAQAAAELAAAQATAAAWSLNYSDNGLIFTAPTAQSEEE